MPVRADCQAPIGDVTVGSRDVNDPRGFAEVALVRLLAMTGGIQLLLSDARRRGVIEARHADAEEAVERLDLWKAIGD